MFLFPVVKKLKILIESMDSENFKLNLLDVYNCKIPTSYPTRHPED